MTELKRRKWLSVKALINNFLENTIIQQPRAPVRQHDAKLPRDESEHVTENLHNAFSLVLFPENDGSSWEEHGWEFH